MKKINYILGLDIGVNSVGWAVVECKTTKDEKEHDPVRLVALNSRIFQEKAERDTEVPKNVQRRAHRSMRRGIARRRGRRDALIKYLQKIQLLPKEINAGALNIIGEKFVERAEGDLKLSDNKEKDSDPARGSYPLLMRVFGLDHPLKPYEFGCVLLQLQKRRGYKSNRGAKYDELHEKLGMERIEDTDPEKTQDKQEGKVLMGIHELKNQMNNIKARTISEFIYKQTSKGPLKRITQHSFPVIKKDKKKPKTQNPNDDTKDESNIEQQVLRTFYGSREIYRKEFNQLWDKQASYLKLKDEDKKRIELLIFYQRPLLYPVPKKIKNIKKIMICHKPIDAWSVGRLSHLRYNDVGACSIFPHKQRAATALLACQEYRTWQFINNIKSIENGNRKIILNTKQRQEVYDLVNGPNYIKKYHNKPFDKQVEVIQEHLNTAINFSEEGSSQRIGNKTAYDIAEIIGWDTWQTFDHEKKNQLVDDLLNTGNKVDLYDKLTNKEEEWKFTEGQAYKLVILKLEQGHMKHCQEAVQAILTRMRDQGKNYKDACNDLKYQIQTSSQDKKSSSKKGKIYIPSVANPRVQKALFEIGRLLPAIIDEYGEPKVIRIELMRELKLSKRDRDNLIKQQRKNRSENEEAKKILQEKGMHELSRDAIRKYRMLKEQKFKCMYCFDCLGWNPKQNHIEEDHILPLRVFYQNYMNTVLVCQTCNQEKGSRTPHEAWRNTEKWENIKTHLALDKQAKKCLKYPEMPVSKIKRILIENFDETDGGFVENQLRDSSYIAELTKEILESSLKTEIQTTKGRATGILRNLWGLNGLLPNPPDQDKETGKNRRDHRHHAIDAFIVAMTDHKTLLDLTEYKKKDRELSWRHSKKTAEECMKHKQAVCEPAQWPKGKSIREDVKELIMKAVVSHQQQQNKIYGALHEESCYAKSCYLEKMDINTGSTTLRRLWKYLKTDPEVNGKEVTWILREAERDTIRQWLGEIDNLPKGEIKTFHLPKLNDKTLDKIVLAHRCYVRRKDLKDLSEKQLREYAGKEWNPGTKHWIMDETVHKQLANWLKTHPKNISIKEGLEKNPPRMKSNKGAGNLIKSVRIAEKFGKKSIVEIRKGRIFKLGANHHVELFKFVDKNTETEKEPKVKARVVSMLEAARRCSCKEPIVNRNPDPNWEGEGWKFSMTLKINDMVLWDKEDKEAKRHLDLGPPIYRVQKMSISKDRKDCKDRPDIFFRHHSTVLSENKYGRIRITSLSKLNCRKISVGVLGDYQE